MYFIVFKNSISRYLTGKITKFKQYYSKKGGS